MRSFGRTGGRPLSARQQRLIDERLPALAIPETGDPLAAFPARPDRLWLEIGFGGGEHVAAQAEANPDVGYLACEVFVEGVAKCLTAVEEKGLSNVRFWTEDARQLIDRLPDSCLDRVFILFPDPWPKKKHHKRRIIQPDFLDSLARIMKLGAHLRFATDVRSYADEALQKILAHGQFDWLAEKADDWRRPPADHVRTRYESKNLGDIAPVFYEFSLKSS
ncbi:tRNA (guanosine(46)-N7)-methyltransferase TrmB [Henriciella mobilis]|uniref:tRNA (guanine-N(7)-)-methyltransferase n=1 Tax=Henriciella mobilis TaxID=2305467 RepID=A0A399RHN2_9PROT|nr:tRNA (guanosine(46)-N7)-methyltransferase TrmB [Henriciella mobilis]